MRERCVDGLRAFAARVGCGVVNTWGAKGVFPWDDPLHFGTGGLQARDFELAGLGDVEVLVTSGLDAAEVTSEPWLGRAEVIDIAPSELGSAMPALPPGGVDRPVLYTALAAVVGPMYAVPGSAPARAAALAASLPAGGVVVAAPGLVGFWIARTFPTSIPGSVLVPASGGTEEAWRAAVELAAAGHPVTLVTGDVDRPPRDLPGITVEVWPAAQNDLDPAPLVAVAGPIVAWDGLLVS